MRERWGRKREKSTCEGGGERRGREGERGQERGKGGGGGGVTRVTEHVADYIP